MYQYGGNRGGFGSYDSLVQQMMGSAEGGMASGAMIMTPQQSSQLVASTDRARWMKDLLPHTAQLEAASMNNENDLELQRRNALQNEYEMRQKYRYEYGI